MYKFLALILLILFPFSVKANQTASSFLLKGLVTDSITLERLEAVTISVEGTNKGALTDNNGIFELFVPSGAKYIVVSSLGYNKKRVPLKRTSLNLIAVELTPSDVSLKEVQVTRKKEKYSKKNNPAVAFVNKIRESKEANNPENHSYYNYDKYEKITLGLNNFEEKDENGWMSKKFPFLWEHVDTSEVSGNPVLIFSVKEKSSKVSFRKEPRTTKELIEGIHREGLDDIVDQQSTQAFLEDIFRDIDLYQNDINILQNRFVSPLSTIAPDFYKFYLTDTVNVDDERCIVLSFVPRNSSMFGFVGQIYVPENDTTMFIKKVELRIPSKINLNFIDHLYINQEFKRASDGSRLKIKDDLTAEISVVSGTQGLYARKSSVFKNHNFIELTDKSIFNSMQSEIVDNEAYTRDDKYWKDARLVEMPKGESEVGKMIAQMRKVPIYYWSEKLLKILVGGYISTGSKSKFDFGPMNTTISGNTIEGTRLRIGGMTTANLSKHWFSRAYVAYGTKDKKLKYSAELEYSFNAKEYHSREFPIHSIKVKHLYDVDQLGQHYLFTNMDNVFLSLKRQKDTQMTYHRVSNIEYQLELYNNLSFKIELRHQRQEATSYMPFITEYGDNYSHYQESGFNVEFRWAPGEKFYQTKSYRIPINLDAPVFVINHTYMPKGLLNSKFTVNKTEVSIQKRFWFSAFGYSDMIVKGGHVWSRVAYPDLLIPNANLSYTIQPESFACLNPMEFIQDSFAQWDITYWANGALFNNIPLFKKLKLREVACFRGLYGHLSKKNNPQYDSELFVFPAEANTHLMDKGPYMEASVGIENIFKCLRVDYVWRLSYLDQPNINKSGIRISLHITF
jgi:hypothetical protein